MPGTAGNTQVPGTSKAYLEVLHRLLLTPMARLSTDVKATVQEFDDSVKWPYASSHAWAL